jgi:formylglycine-generating enzyme required for sulfatase activity
MPVVLSDDRLGCALGGYVTWTPSPGSTETFPIACVDWYTAMAFCIWDGGFLPSEAEWNYAAAGGDEQRVYPWSNPPSSAEIDCAHANYTNCVSPTYGLPSFVGAQSPQGDGKYGQADLSGNLEEWVLDGYVALYPEGPNGLRPYRDGPCDDCANLPANPDLRVVRGGSYYIGACQAECAPRVLASTRSSWIPAPYNNREHLGIRCARAP